MTPNPFLGVFFHWLGGLASGSFYVPYKGVKKWSWETYWLAGGFFSWIICPWAIAYFMTNDLVGVLKQQTFSTLAWTYCSSAIPLAWPCWATTARSQSPWRTYCTTRAPFAAASSGPY